MYRFQHLMIVHWFSSIDTFNSHSLFYNNFCFKDIQRLHYLKNVVTRSTTDIIIDITDMILRSLLTIIDQSTIN